MTPNLVIASENLTPDVLAAGRASSLRFRVSEQLVARFATLTGDRSTVHVDDIMARRTAYRRRVVHGMLPVSFLAAAPPLRVEGFRASIVAISGRFLAPVFAGDRLVLITDASKNTRADGSISIDYRIENATSGAIVTAGELAVQYQPLVARKPATSTTPNATMLCRPVSMNKMRLEEIEVGMKEEIDFEISSGTIHAFSALLRLGCEEENATLDVSDHTELTPLLSVLLFSTSVGVSLPGENAIFVEFSAWSEKPIRLGARYALAGEVVHRSRGTRIVKKQILVHSAERPNEIAVRGKVAALVNTPSARMPSVEELHDIGTGHGLEGKVILVTGASRGIGETTAKMLALCGAKIIVCYHRGAADARRVVAEIEAHGGSAEAIGADVTSEDEVSALVERAVARFGGVDILVNNAVRDFRPIPFARLTWNECQKDIDVIVKGAFLCCQHVIPRMIDRGGGKIINVGTVATDNPPIDQVKYVMAKSALVGLTRSLSVELAPKNIQVNLVVPSFVETDLVAHVQEGFRSKIARETPMGRNASPVDVARAVLFLASSYSSFTTGQKIMVTGGGAPYA